MNQKNIFTAIAAVLILQGIAFYIMGHQIAADAYPNLAVDGQGAIKIMLEIMGALSIAIGLLAYATRTTPGVVGAFTLGAVVILIVTLKHLLVDGVNVPIPAIIIQVLIVLACVYLLSTKRGVATVG